MNRIALVASLAPAIALAAQNTVRGLVVGEEGAVSTLRIVGSAPAQFTVFKLSDPPRIVVDLASSDVSAVASPAQGKGAMGAVTAAQFKGDVGRVTVGVTENARYEVKAAGADVVLTVSEGSLAMAPPADAPKAPPLVRVEESPDPLVVTRRMDEKQVQKAATRLLGVKAQKGPKLLVRTDGEVARFEVIELREPARLALDLYGIAGPKTLAVSAAAPVKGVRLGKYDDRLRVVIDVDAAQMPRYQVTRGAAGLVADFAPAPEQPKVAAAAPPPAEPPKVLALPPEVATPPAPPPAPAPKVTVNALDYRAAGAEATVDIALSKKAEYEIKREEKQSVLILKNAAIPQKLERTLDVSALEGPLSAVSAFAETEGLVKVVADLRAAAADRVEWKGGRLKWRFTGAKPAAVVVGKDPGLTRAAGFATDAPAYALSSAPKKSKYKGKPVDINLKDIELHNLFNYIAEVSKKNLVVADDVKGRITIRLRNVPWEEALDLILKARGLGKEEIGNVIRIAPLERLRNEQREALQAQTSNEELAPLKVRLIPVNYADAGEISSKVKDILSKRGSVTTDSRTNVLIIKDVADSLAKAEGMVRSLDTQTPQVLIESRIVEASTRFVHEAGIQWGGQITMAPITGNPTGLVFPNAVQISGATPAAGVTEGITSNPNFVVNMPAPIGLNTGAGLGFTFGSAGGAAQLNLRLSAFENNGTIRTISAPRVATLDNKEAEISQGIKVPFSQTSAAGVNTTFIEAALELKVKPHVTADGSILLTIAASNNQPNPQLTGSNGQPSISKREAKTEVLLKDGDTTVIGGIYTRSNSFSQNQVPVLGNIPILGWLFKKRNEEDNRTELLIFITPRIVNRQQSVVAAESGG